MHVNYQNRLLELPEISSQLLPQTSHSLKLNNDLDAISVHLIKLFSFLNNSIFHHNNNNSCPKYLAFTISQHIQDSKYNFHGTKKKQIEGSFNQEKNISNFEMTHVNKIQKKRVVRIETETVQKEKDYRKYKHF